MLLEDIELGIGSTDEIQLTTTGRVTGQARTVPVWYVRRDDVMYLMPVGGPSSQWFRNVTALPTITVSARGVTFRAVTTTLTDPAAVEGVVQSFREKYGEDDVARYYPGASVAVEARLTALVD